MAGMAPGRGGMGLSSATGGSRDPACRARTHWTMLCPMARLCPMATLCLTTMCPMARMCPTARLCPMAMDSPPAMAMPHSNPVRKQRWDHVLPQFLVPGEPMPGPGVWGTGGARAARAQSPAGNPAAAAAGSRKAAASSRHTAWGWGEVLGGLSSIAPWPPVPWSSSHGPATPPAPGPHPTALQPCGSQVPWSPSQGLPSPPPHIPWSPAPQP